MRSSLRKSSLSRYAALKVRRGRTLETGYCDATEEKVSGKDGTANKSLSLLEEVILPRKEVIQPHLPVRLPCYDFTPLTLHTFGVSLQKVRPTTSGANDSGGVTGGVYKARERIHRGVLIRDY